MGNFHFFGRGKANFWGGGEGGITSRLASQCPSWGIYKHAPTAFGSKRKRRLLSVILILKKRWVQKKLFLRRLACNFCECNQVGSQAPPPQKKQSPDASPPSLPTSHETCARESATRLTRPARGNRPRAVPPACSWHSRDGRSC